MLVGSDIESTANKYEYICYPGRTDAIDVGDYTLDILMTYKDFECTKMLYWVIKSPEPELLGSNLTREQMLEVVDTFCKQYKEQNQ